MLEQGIEAAFIGVPNMGDGDDADRHKFIANMRVQIPHVLDDGQDLWQEYGVHSQPSMVFVDAAGNRDRHVGSIDTLDLLRLTAELVGDTPGS